MRVQVDVQRGSERWLFAVIAALVGIDLLMSLVQFTHVFPLPSSAAHLLDLAEEGSIPTWYSSVQLLLATLLLGGIATRKFALRDPHRLAWAGLTIGFAFLSLDETASIHEEWGLLLRGLVPREGIFYFRWTVIALALMPVLLLVFWRFLKSLPQRTRLEVIAAAAVFLGGAVGLELVAGSVASRGGQQSIAYALLNAGENGFELLGIAMLIGTLLRYEGGTEAVTSITMLAHQSAVARFLIAAVLLLAGAGVALAVASARGVDVPALLLRSFDLMRERNVPTWFTSMLLAVCAGLCAVLAKARRTSAPKVAGGWIVLTVILLLHSADEVAELHERVADWIQLQAPVASGYSWPSLAVLLLALPLVTARPWLRRKPDHLRRSLGVAALMFYFGALVCPIILSIMQARGVSRGSGMVGLAGEGLEMAGASYLVYVLARYSSAPSIRG
jgi:hypothetical protein